MDLHVDPHKVSEQAHRIVDAPKPVVKDLFNPRKNPFERFPLLFTLLATFGFVATLYGFEHIINEIELLVDHPLIMLGVGVVTLIFTGTLYKKL